MKEGTYTILSHRLLARDTMEMVLSGDTSALTAPGQFVNIKLEGFFLRRPISVCCYNEREMTLLYKIVGGGTKAMASLSPGDTLHLLVGLGNGYHLAEAGDTPLLVGGGAGVPPLYGLAKALLAQGSSPQVILGFNTAAEIFYEDRFSALGIPVYVTTADGSRGMQGFVTDQMQELAYSYFYACGPMPMFRAIEQIANTSGQYSFEERMGCGFGACMGCSHKTTQGSIRICKEGPVLRREEIIW